MDRLESAVNVTFVGQDPEELDDPAFIIMLDGKVRFVPVTEAAEAIELVTLDVNIM